MASFPSLARPRTLLAAGLLLALAACGRHAPTDLGLKSQTLLVGNGAEPADLDPQVIVAFTDSQIAYTLFEGLTKIDAQTGQAVPAAAQRWDVSPDGLVYTFHLRKEGKWSNGDPVTAEDFAYSFHRILTPAFAASYSYMLWPIKNAEAFNGGKITDFAQVGVKVLDPLTLQLTLERPTPYLPAVATHTTWLPVHQATIEKFGPMEQKGSRWTQAGNLVGNGAFRLVQWLPDSRIAVERNPQYWDDANTKLHRVEFYPFEKADMEELNYQSHQLHATYSLPIAKVDAYRKHTPSDLRIDSVLSTFYLFFNVTQKPFDNVKLRLALSHALDRALLASKVTSDTYRPTGTFVPPDCGGYNPPAGITDDFALARRLLEEAGYPGGRGLDPIEVQCYESEVPLRMMEAIQAMWLKELGVKILIAQVEQKTLFRNEQNKDYTISFSSWIADYPDPLTFLGSMITDNGNNWAGWSSKDYDRLIDQSTKTVDPAQRLELLRRAEEILLSEAPLCPLYNRPMVYAVRPEVKGWTTSSLGFHDFNRIWLQK